MKLYVHILILFSMALFLPHCHRHTSNVSRMAKLYAELVLLKERTGVHSDSVSADSSLALLKKYHFTPEECKNTIQYLNQNPEKWILFYREVSSYLENANKSEEAPPR